ncbi:MAG: hypothetical protein FuToV9_gp1 [Hangzhou totivirus 9]|nr:MAG: hypothetical protein FuToV9_gp1 [Hangzhou totivirus 9]
MADVTIGTTNNSVPSDNVAASTPSSSCGSHELRATPAKTNLQHNTAMGTYSDNTPMATGVGGGARNVGAQVTGCGAGGGQPGGQSAASGQCANAVPTDQNSGNGQNGINQNNNQPPQPADGGLQVTPTDRRGEGPAHGGVPSIKSSSVASSPAEVFAIVQKMFVDPLPRPAPTGVEFMPAGTEILRNKIEEDHAKYSPVMWADPLLPYKYTIAADTDTVDWFVAVGVDVNNSKIGTPSQLALSPLGLQIKAIVDADLSQTGAIRAMIPVPGLKDQKSIATLMHMTDLDYSPTYDEAAIVRLFLLQAATMDAATQVYVSSTIYENALNVYVKRSNCKLVWTPALATSDEIAIGTAESTSTLYFRTIDEYVALITCTCRDEIKLKTKSKKDVSLSDVVFIPVKSCWRGQSWLMPYILSFTTTVWWNHAMTVDVEYTNTGANKVDGTTMKMSFIPKSACAYIPGNYQYICLVIVDAMSQTFPQNQKYAVCKGIAASRSGEFDFSKLVFSYLGRVVNEEVSSLNQYDIVQALNHMMEFISSRKDFRIAQVKAAILGTSRFNGFGAYPTDSLPPNAKDETTVRENIGGPAQFNNKDVIKIGNYVLPDLVSMTKNTRLERMKAILGWRTDPLGYMTYGQIDIKKDATHTPAAWKYKRGCLQYQLTESTSNMRILRATGVFLLDPESDKKILQKPVDVYNTTIAYGSLMLGLTNWAMVELGVTLFEHNRLGKKFRCLPDVYTDLWNVMTCDFVIRSVESSNRIVDEADWQRRYGWIMNMATEVTNVDLGYMDTHYCWNVPWWYVAAISEKFGHSFKCKTPANGELIIDEDSGYPDNLQGWLIEKEQSNQYDLSLLSSSTQYEIRVRRSKPAYFDILTPTANGRSEAYNYLSWNPNNLIDGRKLSYRSRQTTGPLNTNGVVELNVVVFPVARSITMRTCPRAFVSGDNRVDGRDEDQYPRISGGLKWPDPWLDWLIKGGMAILPSLATGDTIGAVIGGLTFLIEALDAWLTPGQSSDDSFRQ